MTAVDSTSAPPRTTTLPPRPARRAAASPAHHGPPIGCAGPDRGAGRRGGQFGPALAGDLPVLRTHRLRSRHLVPVRALLRDADLVRREPGDRARPTGRGRDAIARRAGRRRAG